MKTRYATFFEMIRAIGSRDFCVKFYLERTEIPSDAYQDLFRVYLDEYPEQTEDREEFLKKWHYDRNTKLLLHYDPSEDFGELH